MRIYYDTEFLEDGRTIDLISIGMVADDGREYYAVNSDMPWDRVRQNDWLMRNVVPSLPQDIHHPDWPAVKQPEVIAAEVREFVLAEPDPQLWAYYAAYDHVALCQLWGTMIDLPEGVPMWTNDLKQEAERIGNPELPSMPDVTEHNALSDAREVKLRYQWLTEQVPENAA